MTLRALIFDVDGTLTETEEAHRRAFNESFAKAGLDWHWSVTEYTRLLGTTGGKERLRRYRDEIGAARPSDEEIVTLHADKTARYAEILRDEVLELRPGVRDLIDVGRKAGLKIAVATTTSRSNVDALCRNCWEANAESVFDVIAAGDEVAEKKPAPDVYLLALDRLGVEATQAIAFEDSLPGLNAALSAGLRCMVTPSAHTRHQDFSDATWRGHDLTRAHLPGSLAYLFENQP
ncbi:HAD-IA family hydrolase [Paracoccus onubensis]|uniref:HAD-IA family hydrolase n=1 Tax=Paracoccus onubensis TaxID=1675788 RepID=UPI00272FAE98|nr:HAD-IA family hydrolase [Paracoccus onubensis]MDP0925964.1 HAD-IA family hydrolase [Paracoccus onubensis]